MAQLQQIMFMKNMSMLGGALLISYFGAGPISLDEALTKNVSETAELRSSALQRRQS